jgi:L-asparaginase
VIATGGTIAMAREPGTGIRRPTLTGAELTASVQGLDAPLSHFEPYTIASENATYGHWLTLVREIEAVADSHAGVVVMHGTDTMEEAAYFVSECLAGANVVFCGAMRPPGELGDDGGRNLRDAVTVARAVTAARGAGALGLGTVVVMNHEVLPAWDVVKMDSVALNSFGTRHGTRIATVHDRQLRLLSWPLSFNWIGAAPNTAPDPDAVAYLRLTGSPGARRFAAAIRGADGIVVDTLGAGTVPETVRDTLIAAAAAVPVVLTTRASSGPILAEDTYPHAWDDLIAAGIVLERRLDGPRARIRLSLSLALGRPYEPLEPLL